MHLLVKVIVLTWAVFNVALIMAAPPPVKTPAQKIDATKFYQEYKGHPLSDLVTFREITHAERPNKPVIYLAGDSSLDNKFWLSKSVADFDVKIPAIYDKTLEKPEPKPDVSFWLNHLLGERATCINTAVEESMLRERDHRLLSHDEFIRDNLRSEDTLIVSVGSNDVAFEPSPRTMAHMFQLAWLTPRRKLEDGTASALQYFRHMFRDDVQDYVTRLTSKTKPRAVVICMIYFPLQSQFGQKSWADLKLRALGYNSYPERLQLAIRSLYDIATKQIKVDGTRIVPCGLHTVLDGKHPELYTERVEPNEEGGWKMAVKFMELIEGLLEPASPMTQEKV
ncbi:hypothetical protein BDU57DRAFT_513195 [Ampelomyces quisqualis]|uniref:SGNH hydrolase-type esterase domain-containing protein n=1 Tax=Ampelomyces quisqualis TaxID=50730 RepID=A0A6A5R1B0_AMPQU|nr:hypothetical protein BDU57DRAFT_513195 [Ampelomyces quisqualis]